MSDLHPDSDIDITRGDRSCAEKDMSTISSWTGDLHSLITVELLYPACTLMFPFRSTCSVSVEGFWTFSVPVFRRIVLPCYSLSLYQ